MAVPTINPPGQQANAAPLSRYRLRRWFKDTRSVVGRYAHDLLYKALYFVHLGRPFNRLLCRLGVYHQYQPGVCGWCGNPHANAGRFYRSHPWFSPDGHLQGDEP